MLHNAFAVCPFPTSPNYWKIIGIIVSLIHLLTSFGESLSTVWFTNYIAGVVRKVIGISMHVRLFANSGYVIFTLHASRRTECLANQSLNITFSGQRVRTNP